MAALTSTASTLAGTTPAPVNVSASDTIDRSQFGANGVDVRVTNAGGSPDSVTVVDPTLTLLGSAATNPTVSVPAGQTRNIFVPVTAINQVTGLATIQHSFTTTVTCEVWRR